MTSSEWENGSGEGRYCWAECVDGFLQAVDGFYGGAEAVGRRGVSPGHGGCAAWDCSTGAQEYRGCRRGA